MNGFTTAINIIMTSNAAGVLGMISRGLLGINAQSANAQRSLNSLGGRLAVGGAILAAAGIGLGKALLSTVDEGNRYIALQNQMALKGWDRVTAARAEAAAMKTSNDILTVSRTQALQAYLDMRAAMFSDADTERFLKPVMKMRSLIQAGKAARGETVTDAQANGMAFEVVRAAEFAGLTAPENLGRMERVMVGWTKAMTAFNYQVGPDDFYAALKYTRGAANTLNDDFLVNVLPTLISDLKNKGGGASQAGTAIKWFNKLAVQGRADHKSLEALEAWGLLNPDAIIRNRMGSLKGIRAGGLMGSEIAAESPFDWVQRVYLPQLVRKGVNINDEKALSRVNAEIFGANSIQKMMMDMLTLPENRARIERDRKMTAMTNMDSMTADAAYRRLIRSDPNLARKAVGQQWDNVKTNIGVAIAPAVTDMLAGFAEALNKVAKFAAEHPTATKWLVGIAIGLAAILAIVGVLAAIAGVIALLGVTIGGVAIGWIALVIAGIIAAVTALVTLVPWKKVWKFLVDLGRGIWNGIVGIGKAVWNAIKSILLWRVRMELAFAKWLIGVWNGFLTHAGSFFAKLKNWFTGLLKRLGDWIVGQRGPDTPEARRQSQERFIRGGDWGAAKNGVSFTPYRAANDRPLVVQTSVNLDGRKVGDAVSYAMARDASRQPTGPSGYNFAEGYVPGVQRV